MISPYPSFRQIEKTDKPIFDEAFSLNPPQISEFTFTNLYAWREVYQFRISRLQEFIIISYQQKGLTKFFNPIGSGDAAKIIAMILEESPAEFVRIPEATKAFCENNPRFSIAPDRDNADYLYKTSELIALKGARYDAKRNFIKKFKSRHRYAYRKLNADNIKDGLNFAEVWCAAKGCDNIPGLNDERQAFEEMLLNFSDFNLIGAAIEVEGRMAALAVAERLNPDTLVMHIMKASAEIDGLYPAILNEFLSREAKGFEYLNMEQDLGVPGLRKSKLSYHPQRLIMKYTVRLKWSPRA